MDFNPVKLCIPVRLKGTWDSWLPDDVIVALTSISQYVTSFYPCDCYVTASMVAMNVFHKPIPTQREKEAMRDALNKLVDIEPEWIQKSKTGQIWKINSSKIRKPDTSKYAYTYFLYREIVHINNVTVKGRMNYIAFYLKFRSLFDKDYGVCHFSQDTIAKMTNTKIETIKDRVSKFDKYEIIKIYHPRVERFEDMYNRKPNVYYLPGEYDKAERYVKEVQSKSQSAQSD